MNASERDATGGRINRRVGVHRVPVEDPQAEQDRQDCVREHLSERVTLIEVDLVRVAHRIRLAEVLFLLGAVAAMRCGNDTPVRETPRRDRSR